MSNVKGNLGPICNNCGGFGYTLKLGGGTIDCVQCSKTGVGPELAKVAEVVEASAQYAFLGIHEDTPKTDKGVVVVNDDGTSILEKVVRVRMFINGEAVDEDFTWIPPLTTEERLDSIIKARIEELSK